MATLDAEKALDGVNWNFPFSALGRFGFVKSFVNWIEILFASPSATGIASGLTSGRFALRRGTRRGRPLSSSPFTFFVEPLAAAVRRNSLIEGVPTPKNISEYSVDRKQICNPPVTFPQLGCDGPLVTYSPMRRSCRVPRDKGLPRVVGY